jgi:hypothetical protein
MSTTRTKTRRLGTVQGGRAKLSLYAVERLDPPPTFHKGDGKDDGRNLLGALLIGPTWRTVGYVVGRRGAWSAFTCEQWRQARGRKLPMSQLAPRATVDDAAESLLHTLDRMAAARAA